MNLGDDVYDRLLAKHGHPGRCEQSLSECGSLVCAAESGPHADTFTVCNTHVLCIRVIQVAGSRNLVRNSYEE